MDASQVRDLMHVYLAFALILGIFGIVELVRAAGRVACERQNQLIHAASNLALAFGAWEAHTEHVHLAWTGMGIGVALLICWVVGVYNSSLHNTVT